MDNNQDNQIKSSEHDSSKTRGKKNNLRVVHILGTTSLFVIVAIFFGGNIFNKLASKNMDDIYQKVALDAVAQYEIAERQGDKIQICVQAGLVSASYLQAQNESSYQNWKAIQKIDCARAGMPSY